MNQRDLLQMMSESGDYFIPSEIVGRIFDEPAPENEKFRQAHAQVGEAIMELHGVGAIDWNVDNAGLKRWRVTDHGRSLLRG